MAFFIRKMKIKKFVQGSFQTNTYLLIKGDEAILIDPTGKGASIVNALKEYSLKAILLTHAHFDHIGLVDELIDRFHCPCYAHPDDFEIATTLKYNQLGPYGAVIKHPLTDIFEGTFHLGNFKFDVIHTPGHTPGSLIYAIDNELFTGDTLFKGSIGRTDLFGGDQRAMLDSLNYIKTIQQNYTIHPGHEASSTMNDELLNNPFLKK